MVEALILYYMAGIPFLTAPLNEMDFPTAMEFRIDTSETPLSGSRFEWITPQEIRETMLVPSKEVSPSTYVLDHEGKILEKRWIYDLTDTIPFVERFKYQMGKLSQWHGRVETASCHYVDGRLDSIQVDFDDGVNPEAYYFKIRYDALHRLSQVDAIRTAQDNNPDDPKRMTFTYEADGSITMRRFSLLSDPDTLYKTAVVKDGRLTEIISPLGSREKGIHTIRSFSYAPALNSFSASPRRAWKRPMRTPSVDLLGRDRLRAKSL